MHHVAARPGRGRRRAAAAGRAARAGSDAARPPKTRSRPRCVAEARRPRRAARPGPRSCRPAAAAPERARDHDEVARLRARAPDQHAPAWPSSVTSITMPVPRPRPRCRRRGSRRSRPRARAGRRRARPRRRSGCPAGRQRLTDGVRGMPAMAAMSDRLTERALRPSSRGGVHSRRKCTSLDEAVGGDEGERAEVSTAAASSPTPTATTRARRESARAGGGGARARRPRPTVRLGVDHARTAPRVKKGPPAFAVWERDLEPGHKVGTLAHRFRLPRRGGMHTTERRGVPELRTLVQGFRTHHEQRRGPGRNHSRRGSRAQTRARGRRGAPARSVAENALELLHEGRGASRVAVAGVARPGRAGGRLRRRC